MSDDGRLALVFDDGYATDYSQVRPVLDDAGVPASFAIVSEWIGGDGHLDADQLRELVDLGCEVVAHGRLHRFLAPHRLETDAAPGDSRLAVESHVFPDTDAAVMVGDEYELTDGQRTATVEVAGKGADGSTEYVELDGELSEHWSAEETVFRLPEALLTEEIEGGKRDLEDLGFDPTSFVFPYDATDVRALRIARETFDAVPNAAVRSLPNPPGTAGWNLRRYYLETDKLTPVEIEAYLDDVAASGGLGILAGHSDWETVPPERVEFVIDAALERGIEVTTVADAVSPDGTV